ncbi:hypothetical protein Poli38472_012362 [Pythium oligandrum]|uniref:Uncharacterized protein n=1 Tax=Pythium oligandrum TaxID=41045 RepID=A0A8K1FLK6_PYTOL|nr:hypothetical protein Poli38472_012362 [Pythium oligandrum]|eukprot:TMW67246.1 hypothetical protein Poli38472_012362 [Pythium oligandrum]
MFTYPDIYVLTVSLATDKQEETRANADITQAMNGFEATDRWTGASSASTAFSDTHRTSSESDNDSEKAKKKPKHSTYAARRGEIASLQSEIALLTAKMHEIMETVPSETATMQQTVKTNALLRRELKKTDLMLAAHRASLSSYSLSHPRNPVASPVHLPAEPTQRRAVLEALRESKLDEGLEFILQRINPRDYGVSHRETRAFADPEGDLYYEQCDVTPFEGALSVRDVHDQVIIALSYLEFAFRNGTGMTSVDAHNFDMDRDAAQRRTISTTPEGIPVDKNLVLFRRVCEATESSLPYGLIVMDSVDSDELRPYEPLKRPRMDFTTVVLICPSESNSHPAISVVRWGWYRLPKTQCGLTRLQEQQVLDAYASEMELSRYSIRDAVHFEAPSI